MREHPAARASKICVLAGNYPEYHSGRISRPYLQTVLALATRHVAKCEDEHAAIDKSLSSVLPTFLNIYRGVTYVVTVNSSGINPCGAVMLSFRRPRVYASDVLRHNAANTRL